MRIIARFKKNSNVRFISHLDTQRAFQRALIRARLPMAYTQGFNPHPILSFATALAVGQTSEAEWLDLSLDEAMSADEFVIRLNNSLPEGFTVLEAFEAENRLPALSSLTSAASYIVSLKLPCALEVGNLKKTVQNFMQEPIIVMKNTKNGKKNINLQPLVYSMDMSAEYKEDGTYIHAEITGQLSAQGSLNIELLMSAFFTKLFSTEVPINVHRTCIYSSKPSPMPLYEI